jgi:S-DNA-T family DNA segregation ATPase FtsK/SpoIIIE
MSVHPKNRTNEALGLAFLALTVLLYLALFSYNPLDSSWSVSTADAATGNIIGQVGAWVSDFLFQLLGLSALLVPLPLLILGYKKVRDRAIEDPYVKIFGFLAALLAVSSLLSLLEDTLPEVTNFAPGGAIGLVVAQLLIRYLNWIGSLVVVTTVLVLSVVLLTRFSVDQTLVWMAKRKWSALEGLSDHFLIWRKRRSDRRELARLQKTDQQVVTQQPPRKVVLDQRGAIGRKRAVKVEKADLQGKNLTPRDSNLGLEGEWGDDETPDLDADPPYEYPSLGFLEERETEAHFDEDELVAKAQKLETKCAEFDVRGRVLQIHPGPIVTTFEFKPDPGVKYSRITNLTDDLCLALKAESIRIDRVPGKNTVGIEVPNSQRRIIGLKEILSSDQFHSSSSKLTLGLGQSIEGTTVVTDLTRLPHLLIAGSTGSGKSVGLNCMICSILYKARPDEVRFILVDPKRLELGLYEDIPHLLTPIVTNPKEAANALAWATREMEERYKLLAQQGVRNVAQYNSVVAKNGGDGDEEQEVLPYIVIVVDELADLIMTAGKTVELAVTRLAQMARAVGIHLILATQRPSVDVLTGLIKANFPSRISYRVSTRIDSKVILDSIGAEQLLGMGDMLFLSPGTARLVRIHCSFISEKEILQIVRFLKQQGKPELREEILEGEEEGQAGSAGQMGEIDDGLYDEAARFVVESRKASTSLLQRRFRIGYGRAARLLDIMEHEGLVGPSEGSRAREVLVTSDYFEEIDNRD